MKHLNIFIIITSLFFISCSATKRAAQKNENTIAKTESNTKQTIAPIVEEQKKEITENIVEPTIEEPKEKIIVKPESREEIKTPKLEPSLKTTAPLELFDHKTWDNLIHENVAENGDVNYKGFKSNWSILRGYIADLSKQLPQDDWSKEDKLAYWMNAYNAMTIDLILRNYPVASIKDIKNPWDQRLWKLGAKWYNLNEIEHQILRKMGDARIHFGINCASFSCPPLLNEAFTASKVNEQLDLLSVRFVNDKQRNIITEDKIQVSKIFSWFSKDFKQNGGDLISFLNKYSKTPISSKAKKSFVDYNWDLNETIIQ